MGRKGGGKEEEKAAIMMVEEEEEEDDDGDNEDVEGMRVHSCGAGVLPRGPAVGAFGQHSLFARHRPRRETQRRPERFPAEATVPGAENCKSDPRSVWHTLLLALLLEVVAVRAGGVKERERAWVGCRRKRGDVGGLLSTPRRPGEAG